MKDINFNKINNALIQVYGQVNGFLHKNKEYGAGGVRTWSYAVKFFPNDYCLVKLNGYCENAEHLIKQIQDCIKEYNK